MDEADLFDEIGGKPPMFSFSDYYEGEQKLLKPALEKLGYTDVYFFNLDGDLCGPLVRGCKAMRDGRQFLFSYG